ncbi:MAG: UDP-glucose--hexose-1-phosphate uridylyltransferase [Epulopiscium sp.]|nr:UDP-glucose--hexose-1-phosphate uridylyltransferase [Candidatus Epulonipiscium sp.]
MENLYPQKDIENLIQYALDKELITKYDTIPIRNALMEVLKIKEPYGAKGLSNKGSENVTSPKNYDIYHILDNLLDYAYQRGIIKENTITHRDLFDTKIMGILTPRQGEVIKDFEYLEKEEGIKKATNKFYDFSKNTTYIRMNRINKNLYWNIPTEYGRMEMTVNLSKPEKDPKEIVAAKSSPQSSYPKCLLCIENIGYSGRVNHPARQNHRVIPLNLGGGNWYFQYSPYVYYNEHCIVFNGNHTPMKLTNQSFIRMFDFIERFPHYFVGSNADLPIVGGSILTHDHYQGGRHRFPMEMAETIKSFTHPEYKNVKAGIIKWPLSAIRLNSSNRVELEDLSFYILETWRNYTDKEAGIIAHTDMPHNTITPIVRKNKTGNWEIDLVLRNNRTSDQYPDGIYHPHREVHHIKKENIGLIEVMGLAVLPGRLSLELNLIKEILTGRVSLENQLLLNPKLNQHIPWIKELTFIYGISNSQTEAKTILEKETALKFKTALEHAGVYKQTKEGQQSFQRFLSHMNFRQS